MKKKKNSKKIQQEKNVNRKKTHLTPWTNPILNVKRKKLINITKNKYSQFQSHHNILSWTPYLQRSGTIKPDSQFVFFLHQILKQNNKRSSNKQQQHKIIFRNKTTKRLKIQKTPQKIKQKKKPQHKHKISSATQPKQRNKKPTQQIDKLQ